MIVKIPVRGVSSHSRTSLAIVNHLIKFNEAAELVVASLGITRILLPRPRTKTVHLVFTDTKYLSEKEPQQEDGSVTNHQYGLPLTATH